jgi:hypothetical protein
MKDRMEADSEARMKEEAGLDRPVLNSDGSIWSYNYDVGDDPSVQHNYENYYNNEDDKR